MKGTLKQYVLIATIGLSSIINFIILPLPNELSAKNLSLWLANSIGYAGIVMLLWMYILGAKSVMSLIFQDISPILKIHKWLGKYGSIAILIHPLLITFSYGESLLYSLLPDLSSTFERHVTLGRISIWILVFIWLTSAILRDKIKFRPWKYIHYLAYICLPFALLHIPDVGSNYMAGGLIRLYYFVLVLTSIIFLVLRLRGFLNLDKVKYGIVSHNKLTETDYILRLKPIGNIHLKPRRGQYVYLKTGLISEDHPFSVLQYNENDHSILICYRVFGSFTKYLSGIQAGSYIYLGGPYGSYMKDYNIDDKPAIFISGGIGITPFVDQIISNSGKREQWLFAANKSHSSAVLLKTLKRNLGNNLISIFSQESPSELRPGEESGRLNADIIKKYISEPNKYNFYICGPPGMMQSVNIILQELKVPSNQIYSEDFGW